jgi:hypothetical protein
MSRTFDVEAGDWVQCERFTGNVDTPSDRLPSCYIHRSRVFDVEFMGLAASIKNGHGVKKKEFFEPYFREEIAIMEPKKPGMSMRCTRAGLDLACSL